MTMSLVRRFARRTRNYERIYKRFKTPELMEAAAKGAGCTGFDLIERLYKICSVTSATHRSTFDQEKGLLRKVDRRDPNAFAEDAVHNNIEDIGVLDAEQTRDFDDRVEKCFTMLV